MKKLNAWWSTLTSTLWFVPALLVVCSVALAAGLVQLDTVYRLDLSERWPRLFGAGVQGSRDMLGAIASSVITVAGVVFSITIVVLSLAASQYSPRVLRGFMADRPTQVVLGAFVSIYVYCLVVLRTIRGYGESLFVPSLAVLAAIVLAFIGIALLVYFIHHVVASIQAPAILQRAMADTLKAIDHLFPEALGDAAEGVSESAARRFEPWTGVPSAATGYVQHVDTDGLMSFAVAHDCVIRMDLAIGEFVVAGVPIVSVNRPRIDAKLSRQLESLFTVKSYRTVAQDASFGIQQLVDVALKALSAAANDTTTAIECLHYLTAVLTRLAERRIETPYRECGGRIRVIARSSTFAELVGLGYDSIRRNARGNTPVLSELIASAARVAEIAAARQRKRLLAYHIKETLKVVNTSVESANERNALRTQAQIVLNTLCDDTWETKCALLK